MKKLLILCALLAGACHPATSPAEVSASPAQAAVTAYLKKTLDDPASYQPVRWGAATAFQQREVDAARAEEETAELQQQLELARIETAGMARLIEIGDVDKAAFNREKRAADCYTHRADSVNQLVNKLTASTDTTRLGASIWHVFRAKNKLGALVLDSARFVVKKSGEVVAVK